MIGSRLGSVKRTPICRKRTQRGKAATGTARSVWSADTEVSVPCVVLLPHPGAVPSCDSRMSQTVEMKAPGCGALQTLCDVERRTNSSWLASPGCLTHSPGMSGAKRTFDYDLAIIGGGSCGYAAARTAAGEGLKTVVIEGGEEVGGLCILRGCMPTKALLYAAEVMHWVSHPQRFGIQAEEVSFNFAQVMARKD